ncbi:MULTISPECIES: TrbC/VirB2 family protein [unclassified Campylobacter]|uniref:TrbC/VirB2 family protein n=1 Tax=unclassified Campylobacter TaxID=2593542 RepID=UPI001D8D8FAD|nr:TrbC/VirB2 family protein [Campylobacter sp. RM12651]MBZ7978542.1 TrbC/VirB2 family protein [Campylobacter sp. RM12654]MBZ7980459.1 TrbC/VirB2 family protein [Campylobacter sp. RM12642]MBZ7990618.1 TrbC/VirB2 family protein [Campylobacter sp. RM9331]MBZ8004743.1 TrbC/VirB2 family protein [Campylobacter sp. RM9332]ULO04446.1 P-type type IV conjugative transfer system relaxase TrbC/VirB2 [Campylobacter sp. RM12651]
MKNNKILLLLLTPNLVLAAGGLSKVNNLFDTVLGWILAVAFTISTIALVYSGIKVMWGGHPFQEYSRVIVGSIVIASSSAIIGAIYAF